MKISEVVGKCYLMSVNGQEYHVIRMVNLTVWLFSCGRRNN